jgi:chemotaxis protein MotB
VSRFQRAPVVSRSSRDRWLVAYADMLTLLFAVFVSLYAARVDFLPPSAAAAAPSEDVAGEDAALWDQIQEVITGTGSLSTLEMRREERGLVISMPEAGAFPAGRAELSSDAQKLLFDLADRLRATPGGIRVEGHTDDVPIHNAAFASNWELSTARATEVVQFLVMRCGLAANRLSAAGFGEFRPLTPNDSDAARAKNRRVELIVLNAAAAR